jgi:hypothetical protein
MGVRDLVWLIIVIIVIVVVLRFFLASSKRIGQVTSCYFRLLRIG